MLANPKELWVELLGGRKESASIIDIGATSRVLASRHVQGGYLEKRDIKPIRVGNGSIQWSLGGTFVDVLVVQERMKQKVQDGHHGV